MVKCIIKLGVVCMSEERFKLAEDEDGLILIYDTKKDKWIGFNSQVVDLLNFQDNGIKALRKEVEEKTQMSKLIQICNKHKLRIMAQDQEIQIFKNIIKKWLKKCDLLERYIESKGLSEECMKMIKEELED